MDRNLIVLPDGTEIFSGSGLTNAIQSCKWTETVNADTELTLGSVCSACIEVTIIAPGGTLSIEQGTEITYYKVDDVDTRTKVGLFICEKPTRSGNLYKFTAYDRVTLLDVDMTEWLSGLDGWPYTVQDFAAMVCAECGLTLTNTSLINGDYEIAQFSYEATGRQIMQWIGQLCARFCRATVDGDVEFAWYSATGQTILPSGSAAYFAGTFSYEDFQTAAVDKVQIRNGESDVGVMYPADASGTNAYVIDSNPLVTSSSTEAVSPVAQAIYEAIEGITYTPCKVSIRANLSFRAGDIIQITDGNGNTVTAYIMTRTQSGQKVTLECTGSASRDSVTATNSTTISSLRGKVLNVEATIDGLKISNQENEDKLASLELDIDGIRTKVSDLSSEVSDTVSGVEILYALGESATEAPSDGWQNPAPEWVDGMYMWQKTITTYTSGDTEETVTCISGATGASGTDGERGTSLLKITTAPSSYTTTTGGYTPKYRIALSTVLSQSGVTEVLAGDILEYSYYHYPVGYIDETYVYLGTRTSIRGATGSAGADGADGRGVESTTITYQESTSGTTVPTGEWSSDIPTVTEGNYLWTRTVFLYTDNTSETMYSVSRNGTDGSDGSDGVGISSVVNYYLATSAASGVSTSTSGWTTDPQSVTEENKYLWNYEVTTLSDGNSDITTPCIIGMYSADGTDGTDGKGISSITEYYAVSTSNTSAPTAWSTTVPSMSATNKYLWNYEIVTYTDATTEATSKRVIGVYGDSGTDGADGEDGVGISSIVPQYYLSSSSEECVDGEWADEQPEWQSGYYLWTRSYITWTDGSTSATTPVLAGALNSANEKVTELETTLEQTASEIRASVESLETSGADTSETVAQLLISLGELQAYVETVEQTASDDNDAIYEKLSSLISQTAEQIDITFNSVTEVSNDLASYQEELATYIRLSGDGVEIGKSDSDYSALLSNDRLEFRESGEVVAYITDSTMYITTLEVTESAWIACFEFKQRSNGHGILRYRKRS